MATYGDPCYAGIGDLKAWIAENTTYLVDAQDGSLDATFQQLLETASRMIDEDCGRTFYKATGEKRSFYGSANCTVRVVDLVSVTLLQICDDADDEVETTITSADYVLLPKAEGGSVSSRYQTIRMALDSSYTFYPGYLVEVTGNWGYVTADDLPPEPIVRACVLKAARLWARRAAPLATADVPGTGIISPVSKLDADYQDLIGPYIHPRKAAGVA